jgi:hypothetical protein
LLRSLLKGRVRVHRRERGARRVALRNPPLGGVVDRDAVQRARDRDEESLVLRMHFHGRHHGLNAAQTHNFRDILDDVLRVTRGAPA